MKKIIYSLLFSLLWLSGGALTLPYGSESLTLAPADSFVTVWDLSKPGTVNDTISFGTAVTGTVHYSWKEIGGNNASGMGTFSASPVKIKFTGVAANAKVKLSIDTANFRRIEFISSLAAYANKLRIIDVSQWGKVHWSTMNAAFDFCSNLGVSATDIPNLSAVTDMSYMFRGCSNLQGPANINTWNTSTITEMAQVFGSCTQFNQPIWNWNTANVTNMSYMFSNASAFNQPIGNWNTTNVTNMSEMFRKTAFNQPIGNWNTTNVTNMSEMFREAAFNQPIENWNTANVTDMSLMFYQASAFNQPIGKWNTANVTNMIYMFNQASAFNQNIGNWNLISTTYGSCPIGLCNMLDNSGMDCINYSNTLLGWAANPNTPDNLILGAQTLNYNPTAIAPHTKLEMEKGWAINGDMIDYSCAFIDTVSFITIWDLSKPGSGSNNEISMGVELATGGTGYYYWEEVGGTNAAGSGTFTSSPLSITGLPMGAIIKLSIDTTNFRRIEFGTSGSNANKSRLIDVSQWGKVHWSSMLSAFINCNNLNISATETPDLSNVSDMSAMFSGCSKLNGPSNMNSWDVSHVTNMQSLFDGCTIFNQPVGNWEVGMVTNMGSIFFGATAFNQDIGAWNTGAVTDMPAMFSSATAFNQDIGAWNTGAVTDMNAMFSSATAFNQDIGAWNTGNVTNMGSMFSSATAFNQDIGAWNTGNVTYMVGMFDGAIAFNQDIGGWNTGAVIAMKNMFDGAIAFNQNIGAWNLNSITSNNDCFAGLSLCYMLDNSGMDCINYSNTLRGWAANPNTPNGISFGATGQKYHSLAQEARDSLDNDKGWTITDAGVFSGGTLYYADTDGDTYGDPATGVDACAPLPGYVINNTDCDDTNASITQASTWYKDGDNDMYGDAMMTTTACTQPTGYVSNHLDCDDTKSSIHPNAPDNTCNNIDEDCDGTRDEDYIAARCTECFFGQIRNTVEDVVISGLNATNITVNSVTLSWASNSSFDSYTLEYKLSSQGGGAWTKLENLLVTSTDITGLQQNKMYDFRVRGKCNNSYGKFGTSAFTTNAIPCVDPPADLKATNITANSALISWSAVPGAINYTIQKLNTTINQWQTVAMVTSPSYQWNNLVPKTVHYWRVWASCASSASAIVNSDFRTKNAPDPACPSSQDTEPNSSMATAVVIPFNTTIKGRISTNGDRDFYKFTVGYKGSVKASMTNLPADYDLRILTPTGAIAATSKQWMTLDESVEVILPAGDYFVRVDGYNGAFDPDDCYALMIELKTASLISDQLEARDRSPLSVISWPSPVKDKLQLKLSGSDHTYHADLYNLQGKQLESFRLSNDLNAIDMLTYPAGTYILQVSGVTERKVVKIIKE